MGSEPNRLPFGNAPQEEEPAKLISPLPDIQTLIAKIRRQADRAKTVESSVGFIDVGIEELKQIKLDGWRQYHELVDRRILDDPDPFWNYDTDLDKAINELGILRQRLILEESYQAAPVQREEPSQPKPVFTAAGEGSASTAPQVAPPAPEVMDIRQLASYLGMSDSWLYKNYESEGLPYFLLGTSLRFRKDEIDSWSKKRTEALPSDSLGVEPVKEKRAAKRSRPAPTSDNSQAILITTRLESADTSIHPKIISRMDRLVSLLYEKGYLSQGEALRFKNWMLTGARRDPGDTKIAWLKQRKSLVTCIILCHYAELVSISEAKGKEPPRPDFGATIERDFIAEDKPMLQNIDRDFAKDIDREVKFFIEYIRSYAKRNELDFPLDNSLAAALAEYFDDIDGSEGLAVEATEIKTNGKDLDFQMMKLFHTLSTS